MNNQQKKPYEIYGNHRHCIINFDSSEIRLLMKLTHTICSIIHQNGTFVLPTRFCKIKNRNARNNGNRENREQRLEGAWSVFWQYSVCSIDWRRQLVSTSSFWRLLVFTSKARCIIQMLSAFVCFMRSLFLRSNGKIRVQNNGTWILCKFSEKCLKTLDCCSCCLIVCGLNRKKSVTPTDRLCCTMALCLSSKCLSHLLATTHGRVLSISFVTCFGCSKQKRKREFVF